MTTQEVTMRETATVHVHMNKRHWSDLSADHEDILTDSPENRVIVVHESDDGVLDMTQRTKEEKLIDCKDAVERILEICNKYGWANTTVNVYLTGAASHAGVFCLHLAIGLMAQANFDVQHDINFKQWDRDEGEFWTAADLWDVIQ